MILNIKDIDKAELLKALYDSSKLQGLGFLQANGPMSLEQAQLEYDASDSKYFDYHHGKVMKVQLDGNTLDTWGYDRDNGDMAALIALMHLGAEEIKNDW